MKYRMLSDEELKHLEGDLKAFLIINGLEGDSWKKLNEEDPDKALALVELFSDQVLQTVYEKVEYLELRTPESCLVFKLNKDELLLISLNRLAGSTIDLSTVEGVHDALVNHFRELQCFTSKRSFTKERELEIHQLISEGCVLSTAEFWDALVEVLNVNQ